MVRRKRRCTRVPSGQRTATLITSMSEASGSAGSAAAARTRRSLRCSTAAAAAAAAARSASALDSAAAASCCRFASIASSSLRCRSAWARASAAAASSACTDGRTSTERSVSMSDTNSSGSSAMILSSYSEIPHVPPAPTTPSAVASAALPSATTALPPATMALPSATTAAAENSRTLSVSPVERVVRRSISASNVALTSDTSAAKAESTGWTRAKVPVLSTVYRTSTVSATAAGWPVATCPRPRHLSTGAGQSMVPSGAEKSRMDAHVRRPDAIESTK